MTTHLRTPTHRIMQTCSTRTCAPAGTGPAREGEERP
jgi:hypothetical protein